ncbi:MAG: hypothetical protein EHM21_15565, partial [Chloroflexi bacterium]
MEYRFDFDDQLEDLPIAFDLDAVAQLFQQKLFGLASAVKVLRLQDAKYHPSKRCVTTYEVVVDRPGEPPFNTICVLEFTPDGVHPRVYLDDTRMPALSQATDPVEMHRRICQALALDENVARMLNIEPVRYKPGLHCVFRYTIGTPSGKQVFYGKLFNGPIDDLMINITALHQESETNPEMPRI